MACWLGAWHGRNVIREKCALLPAGHPLPHCQIWVLAGVCLLTIFTRGREKQEAFRARPQEGSDMMSHSEMENAEVLGGTRAKTLHLSCPGRNNERFAQKLERI